MDAPLSSRPPPEAVASLGALREVASAVRNLEQLLASMHVGPKTLSSVVPEIRGSCESWRAHTTQLIELVDESLELRESERIRDYGLCLADGIERALSSTDTQLNAKRRLELERSIVELGPNVTAFVEHLEMLVEATWAHGLSLPLAELLSSRPPRGSERPYLPLGVRGLEAGAEVSIPARMGLRALGVLAGVHRTPNLEFSVRLLPGQVELSLVPRPAGAGAPDLVAHLPALHTIEPSVPVASALLRHYGGDVRKDGRQVLLPASSPR